MIEPIPCNLRNDPETKPADFPKDGDGKPAKQ